MKCSVLELQTSAQAAFVDDDFVAVRLEDGREIRFPISANRRLREATSAQRERIEIICNGTGLHSRPGERRRPLDSRDSRRTPGFRLTQDDTLPDKGLRDRILSLIWP